MRMGVGVEERGVEAESEVFENYGNFVELVPRDVGCKVQMI